MLKRAIVLSVVDTRSDADSLPTEFRIFRAGVNSSTKGDVTFDEIAAANVMAAHETHGVDLPIDLEHLSLAPDVRTDYDARGWFKLAVRDGELWAVNVTWTSDGEMRLREKRQRYISPAFNVDAENRVTRVINAALTALPATYNAQALIAANVLNQGQSMDPALIKKALDVIAAGDANAALELLNELVAAAAGAESGDKSPEGDPAKMPPALSEEQSAALSQLLSITGCEGLGEAIAKLSVWKSASDTNAAQLKTLELNSRKELAARLVKLGAETPATAWKDPANKVLSDRLLSENIDDLRGRVTALSAARGGDSLSNVKPPARAVEANAADIAAAKKLGITVTEFADRKAKAIKRAR